MATSDIQQLDTLKLRQMADELKGDARDLWEAGYKTEAVTLIRLFRRLTAARPRTTSTAGTNLLRAPPHRRK